MDELVKQAMKKWPNVPAAFGWLGLDARGHWHLRDAQAQAQGDFGSGRPGAKGAAVTLEKLQDFIARNYGSDESGRWFFQNGPQRVFVELECTPWVLRLQLNGNALQVHTHTAQPFAVEHAWLDEQGRAFLSGSSGVGLVHTVDALVLVDAIEAGLLPEPQAIDSQALAEHFHFVASPAAQAQV